VVWFGYGLSLGITSSASLGRLALVLVLTGALTAASVGAWKRSLAYLRAEAPAGGAVKSVLRCVVGAMLFAVFPSASAAGAVFLTLIVALVLVGIWVPYEHPVE
jgi:hypothetical protein